MKNRLKPISDQVVVLFGATSGIGLETALRAVEEGANVVIVGRTLEGLNEAVERVREHSRSLLNVRHQTHEDGGLRVEETVIGMEADASEWEQVKNVADQTMAIFGRIDTWVHLAAVSEWALFEDTSPDEFRRIIDVNLVGSAYGAMAALPYMKQQQGGSIILISSIAGRVPVPYQTAYSASKHGVLGMAEALRMELRHEGVPVNITTILPSSINTPLFSKARTKLGVEPEPIPPVYDPRVVAKAILYAAQHPVREMIVGGAGYTLQSIRRISSPLSTAYMNKNAFRQQRSNETKSPQEADNLYHHIAGHNQVVGEFGPRAKNFSMYSWFSTHPIARMILMGAVLGGVTFLGVRAIQARRKPSFWKRMRSQVKKVGKNISKISMPEISMPSIPKVDMPDLSGVQDRLSNINMPRLRRKKTLMQRAAQRFEMVREQLPERPSMSLLESLPLVGLLPFLHKETRMDGAKKQVRKVAKRVDKTVGKTVGRVDKAIRDVSVKDAIRSIRPELKKKEVYRSDKVSQPTPGGQKEVVYQKTKEKMPSGEKETIYEKVEETYSTSKR